MGLPYAFASHFAPAYLSEALDIYRSRFQPSIYLQEPYTMAAVNVVAAETTEAATFASTSFLQLARSIVTGKPKALSMPVKSMNGLWNAAEKAAIKQMRVYSFVGDKTLVQQQLQQFLGDTQVDELMIVSHIYDQEVKRRSYEIVAEIV